MSEILYRWALGVDGALIDVQNLSAEDRGRPYTCPSCGGVLLPRLGKVKVPHFAHKADTVCSGETYLHTMGKRLFVEAFEASRKRGTPFGVQYQRSIQCKVGARVGCERPRPTFFPLSRIYRQAQVEAPYQGFVVDILLSAEFRPELAVEIAVTHKCEEAKRAAGFPILEIPVRTHEDLDKIRSGVLVGEQINWRKQEVFVVNDYVCKECPGVDLFVVYKSGKPFLHRGYKGEPMKAAVAFRKEMNLTVDEGYTYHGGTTFFDGILDARREGVRVAWEPSDKRVYANWKGHLRMRQYMGVETQSSR